ncbi:MAG: hypothetical protein KDA05_08710, partial [Phycisphaerales bacterium]|nr:hypothetical protein [Phycisphaerales bacterium]
GSWFVEALTDQIEGEALALIAEIDAMGGGAWKKGATPNDNAGGYGGAVAGIHKGYFRRAIAEASYRFSEECEAGDRIIVGVNEYVDKEEERPIDILVIPDTVETEQNERLAAFKQRRDAEAVEAALERIRRACRDGDTGGPSHGGPDLRAGSAAQAPAISQDAIPSAEALGLDPHNVMPALVAGALANCTLGEMVQAMADIYGRYSGGPEW